MQRILEEDLHLPTLYLVNSNNGTITTSELSEELRNILNPRGEDLEILDKRSDDKFSQIVRNLTAKERSFVKNGFIARESGRNSPLFITEKGIDYLNTNIQMVEYLFNNNFKASDVLDTFNQLSNIGKKAELFDENTTINEGTQNIVKTKVYKRSSKLRVEAIKYYTEENKIKCKVCCFDFEDFYGEHGKGFIEIHHQKPVYQFDGDDTEKTIGQAIKNVIPVCPNCHRMIHRSRTEPLSLDEIKKHVENDLDFCED